MTWRGLLIGSMLMVFGLAAPASAKEESFNQWMVKFRSDAARQGIPADVLDDALGNVELNDTVIRLDRKQPENTLSFGDYEARIVSDQKVEKGREMMAQYGPLLHAIGMKYGVQPRYIVALWGIETNYGSNIGNFSLTQSLASLAYEGRRADFFREELMNALLILAQEHMSSVDFIGSWAGAMGQCQFMPSTYLKYAVDWDGDGKRDVWNSMPDAFASIANYLHALGWNDRMIWGRPVEVPEDFKAEEADIHKPRPMSAWSARRVTLPDGTPLTPSNDAAYVIYPGKPEDGTYLVTDNYRALLQWNRSRYFATAVGLLADRIGEKE